MQRDISEESGDLSNIQNRLNALQALHLILPLSMVPVKKIHLNEEDEVTPKQANAQNDGTKKLRSVDQSDASNFLEKKRLRGYETLQELRDRASSFRQDYLNWRKLKPKGAKGEAADLFERPKIEEAASKIEESLIRQIPALTLDQRSDSEASSTVVLLPKTPSMIHALSTMEMGGDVVTELPKKTADQEEAWLRFYYNPFTPAAAVPEVHVSTQTLSHLASRGVKIPAYNRNKHTVTHWIMHLGVGQFHRSHQLVFLDDLLSLPMHQEEQSQPKWGYCGIGLMPFDIKMRDALRSQDLLYTVMTRTNTSSSVRIVGSMFDYIFAYDEYEKALEKLLCPDVHIVSLTITEKGYCQNVHGTLDVENPLVLHDLNLFKSEPLTQSPRTAIGFLYWGLSERYRRNLPFFTILSCDNLPENGHVAKNMVLSFASLVNPSFVDVIDKTVKFPCTMVDRITPATVLEHREILAQDYGLLDEWPVVAEDFMQWAIEDNFTVRPHWEKVGALLVSDVRPLELMKLRLLNGGHCMVGYISYLAGYEFVDDAVNDVKISSFLRAYMDEMTSTIRNVSIEVERYKEKIVERFGNRMIKDNLLRLCEDGSTKIYNTMKDALVELLNEQRHVHCTSLGLAAFILFLVVAPPEIILDAKKEKLISLAKNAVSNLRQPDHVATFLHTVFGTVLGKDLCLIHHVALALFALQTNSTSKVLHCGGTFEALFETHFRCPDRFKHLMQFVDCCQ